LNKHILRLAVPNILTNITVPLLGTFDLFLMGHLQSHHYLGAVSLGNTVIHFLYWNFAFIRMSNSGITAQAFGSENHSEVISSLARALLLALGGAVLLIVLQTPISWLAFKIVSGEEVVETLAKQYFHIRIFAAPATLALFALNGWFIGLQNSIFPMIISILVNVSNIGLNLLFVRYFDMKSDGVAWGTLVAQYIGLTTAVIFFFSRYNYFLKHLKKDLILNIDQLKRFFHVNKDIFIRTFGVILVLSFFTMESASKSTLVLDVNAIMIQYLFIFSFFLDGFALAGEALIGKYTGQQKQELLRKCIRLLFFWGTAIAIAFTLVYALLGKEFLYFLTSIEDVRELAHDYFPWVIFIPLAGFVAFVWDGIYIGATASKLMRNAMIIACLGVFFPVYLIFEKTLHNHSLYLALLLFFLTRGVIQTLWAKKALGFNIVKNAR
jgi:MATE family multidrug resistance protein